MLKTWKAHFVGAALVAVVGAVGCYDFGPARDKCEEEGRCDALPDGGPDGGEPCEPSDPNDVPDDNFQDTNCDGVDGIATAGLFVDPEGGSDENAGTRQSPVRTISKAVSLLQSNSMPGITALYLARGTYNEEQIVLNVPVSLHGAYGGLANGWKRGSEHFTHLDGGSGGFTVSNLGDDAGVRMEWLTITSATATTAGAPSIAMRILGTHGLQLRKATLAAGLGANGARGRDGDAGTPGPDGGPGEAAVQASNGGGGLAPSHFCGTDDRSGGDGQRGRQYTAGETGFPGKPNTPGGDGGTAGAVVGSGPYSCGGGSGQEGYPGTNGTDGGPGSAGSGLGVVSNGTWNSNQNGLPGAPGTSGAGGGGGGSGGGCPTPSGTVGDTARGGGSGAGGGGGCGGQEGQGGGGGGASIALLLIDSTVQVEEVTLRTRGGGAGGAGGAGGLGGPGGLGGTGGAKGVLTGSISGSSYVSEGGIGGKGGPGGTGGPGGPGGGGAGGPSVGVWCSDAGVIGTATESLNPGGAGGPGGGGSAPNGPVIPYQNCIRSTP